MPTPPPLPPRRFNPNPAPGFAAPRSPEDDAYLDDFEEPPEPPRRHGLATAALALGISGFVGMVVMMVALVPIIASGQDVDRMKDDDPVLMVIGFGALAGFICSPTAFIMGIIALVQIAKPHPPRTGKGAAIGGILFSILAAAAFCVGIWVLVDGELDKQHRAVEQSNLRQIGMAMMSYADDNVGHYPTHAVKLAQYLPPGMPGVNRVFKSAIDESNEHIPQFDYQLPPDMRDLAGKGPDAAKSGAYTYGGYWFVVHTRARDMRRPSEDIVAFSRRYSPDQDGRAVLFGDGHTEWLSEPEFRLKLDEANKRRLEKPLLPIETDD